jgi:hypothetical protein
MNGELLILATSWSNISGLKTENSYGENDNWILKLDEQLNIIQQKTIGGNLYEHEGRFIEMPNGNLCIATTTESTSNQFQSEQEIGNSDIWIYLLDPGFNVLADQTIGTIQYEVNVWIRLNANQTELNILMSSNGDDTNDKTCPSKGVFDCWGVRLNATLDIIDKQSPNKLSIYPNPTSNFITIENNNAEQFLSIDLLDYTGKQIKSIDPQNTSINLSDLNPGIYLLRITSEKGNFCERIRLE